MASLGRAVTFARQLATKLATPVLFLASLPLVLLLQAWGYYCRGGRQKADGLGKEYPELLGAFAERLGAACGTTARVERVTLKGARVHRAPGSAEATEAELTLETVVVGERRGKDGQPRPVAVLLHGYPDTVACFERQAPALVKLGYRVVLPHLRGYGGSDAPAGWRNYRLPLLALDVARLIETVSPGRPVVLGGHDWGGQVAWSVAHWHSALVDRLVIVNSPHPATFVRLVTRNVLQAVSSWYMLFYQLPWLPEQLFLMAPLPFAERIHAAVGIESHETRLAASAFLQPGSYTGMLNYYRAMARGRLAGYETPKLGALPMPVLHVWGEGDRYLIKEGAESAKRFVPNGRVVFVDAGHFATRGAAEQVAQTVVAFLHSS